MLDKYRSFKPFTESDAWMLFKLAAIAEAGGWTLLIGGILIKYFLTPGNNIPVLLAGQLHGTIFLIYIAAVIVLSPSLGWSPRRTLAAGLCSVPPYGTLVFEMWQSHRLKQNRLRLTMRRLRLEQLTIDP